MRQALLVAIVAAAGIWSGSANAQPAGMGGMGLGPRAAPAAACPGTPDPVACEARRTARLEARQRAIEACRDVVGPDRRRCIRDLRLASEDCAAAPSPARCAEIREAYGRCKTFAGPEMRTCMRDELPPPDCAKAADPKRCEAHAQAREACKDKAFGPARRQCMSEQPGLPRK